jgi:hypothetical protein
MLSIYVLLALKGNIIPEYCLWQDIRESGIRETEILTDKAL